MRFAYVLIFCYLSGAPITRGQDVLIDPTRVYENSDNILFELKPQLAKPNAQYYYISEEFRTGRIFLTSGMVVENLPMRYDIMRNRMEVIFKDEVRLLYASKIDSFYWFDTSGSGKSKFIRCSEFIQLPESMKGFLEIITEGALNLGSYTYLKVYPATSSVALSGSHRKHNIFKKEDFFIIENQRLQLFPKKRKLALELMTDHRKEVQEFIREKGLLFSRKDDLIKILDYYNSLK